VNTNSKRGIIEKCQDLIKRAERLKELARKNIENQKMLDELLAKFKL
jgi:hypothetical protein